MVYNNRMEIKIPTKCPECNSVLHMVNTQLFCKNIFCGAKVYKRVEHFAKAVGIKGLGEKTIEKLEIQSIPEIYFLEEEDVAAVVGEKTAKKLIDQINNSKNASLEKVLSGMSIPLIGKAAAKKIAEIAKDFDQITYDRCKIAGLGDRATSNITEWIATEYVEIKEFLPFSFETHNNNKSATRGTVCITGRLVSYKSKAEATEKLESRGYTVSDTVNKSVHYLVDEQNKGSSKRIKADKLNIQIIDNLKEFLND